MREHTNYEEKPPMTPEKICQIQHVGVRMSGIFHKNVVQADFGLSARQGKVDFFKAIPNPTGRHKATSVFIIHVLYWCVQEKLPSMHQT